jgi:hypothetical protein
VDQLELNDHIVKKCMHASLILDDNDACYVWRLSYIDVKGHGSSLYAFVLLTWISDDEMPGYDEKTDIWRIPDMMDAFLGKYTQS